MPPDVQDGAVVRASGVTSPLPSPYYLLPFTLLLVIYPPAKQTKSRSRMDKISRTHFL